MQDLERAAKQFHELGFVILEDGVPPADLDLFRSALGRLIAELANFEGIDYDDVFHGGLVALDRKNHARIHQIYNTIRRCDVLARILAREELSAVIKELLGLEQNQLVYEFYHVCRIDPPSDERFLLNWHQESYSSLPGVPSVQLWAPLIGPNNRENGSIEVLPGSHREGEIPHFLQEISPSYVSFYVPDERIPHLDQYEPVTVETSPGDVLLFHPHLFHRSNSNPGPRVRYSLTAHFMNPYDPKFEMLSDDDLLRYNRARCENASEFAELISNPKQTYS